MVLACFCVCRCGVCAQTRRVVILMRWCFRVVGGKLWEFKMISFLKFSVRAPMRSDIVDVAVGHYVTTDLRQQRERLSSVASKPVRQARAKSSVRQSKPTSNFCELLRPGGGCWRGPEGDDRQCADDELQLAEVSSTYASQSGSHPGGDVRRPGREF